MKSFILAAAIAGTLAACAIETVENVKRSHPGSPVAYSFDEVEALIIDGALQRGWRVERLARGHLVASLLMPPGYEAAIDIMFDEASYEIAYKSSSGLSAQNGMIHSYYNYWIRLLDSDIQWLLTNRGRFAKLKSS